MTPELYERTAPALTVHSHRRGIDPRHAHMVVLNALAGERKHIVPALLEARQLGDTALIGAAIRQLGLSRRFLTNSRRDSYSVRAQVQMESGTVFLREAIIRFRRRDEMPFEILDWRRVR